MPTKVETVTLHVDACPICGNELHDVEKGQNCRSCGSRARLRALCPVLRDLLPQKGPTGAAKTKPLLAFATTASEARVLSTTFASRKSVSLFGNYSRADHESGVDVRDLSRYAEASFSGVFASLLFDYFVEHREALAECYRVIAPGGLLLTHVAPYRLTDGEDPPRQTQTIARRAGFFDYLPEKTELPDVSVGRSWFIHALQDAGFHVTVARVHDAVPGLVSEWFIGLKVELEGLNAQTAFVAPRRGLKSVSREVFRAMLPARGKLAVLAVDEIQLPEGPPLAFLEDSSRIDGRREVIATDRDGRRLFISDDSGDSFVQRLPDLKFEDKIRAVFTLMDGKRIVKLAQSPSTYLLGENDEVVDVRETGAWPWHGSQGIGQAPNGTVMFAEYAAFGKGEPVPPLSVWRMKSGSATWERVLTLAAANRPPEGEIRHFHLCRPNPVNDAQWLLAAGDMGRHNRLWTSDDDGETWDEVDGDTLQAESVRPDYRRGMLRLTQVSATSTGEIIWGTDDRLGAGRAALMTLRLDGGEATFRFLAWAGPNAIRNAIALGDDSFLFVSESRNPTNEQSELVLYDARTNHRTVVSLPNFSGADSPVTASLGSAAFSNGVAFLPSFGALFTSSRRGVLRLRWTV